MFARRDARAWTVLAVAVDLAVAVADIVTSGDLILTSAFVIPPLALAIVGRPPEVAAVGALSIVLAVLSGAWDDFFASSDHVMRVSIVTTGSLLAVLAARSRRAAAGLAGELGAARMRMDAILAALAEAVTVQDESGKTIYANDAAIELLGASSLDEILAAEPGQLAQRFTITREDDSPVGVDDFPGVHAAAGEDAPPLLTRSVDRATGRSRWLLTKATAVREPDGRVLAVNVIEDVTESKEGERRERFLARAGALLAASLDYEETLERVTHLAVPELADWCALDVVDARGGLQRVGLAHTDPERVEFARRLNERHSPDLSESAGLAEILRTGQSAVYPDITEEMLARTGRDPEHLKLVRTLGMRSGVQVPMTVRGRTTGVITFATAETGRVLLAEDLPFFEQLALLAATAVDNARQYTDRTRASETLQRSLLPDRLPDLPGWRTASWYQPGAPDVEVGGDFYDVFAVADGFMVLVGDVTGKGVQAAAMTSLARHTARTAALYDPRPVAVLRLLNRVLREQSAPSFVTVVCARLQPEGLVTIAAAGHPLPLRAPAAGGAMELGGHGMLLGATEETDWVERPSRLVPGDTLVFYTDGVTDTPGHDGRFGEERLARLVAGAPRDPAALIETIAGALVEFETAANVDDRAVLAVQYVAMAEAVAGGPLPRALVSRP